jgi:hypothetical protein
VAVLLDEVLAPSCTVRTCRMSALSLAHVLPH